MKKNRRQKEKIIELILPAIFLTILLSALQVILEGGGALFSESIFLDADVYSWLVRVEDLQEGQSWFDHALYRVNPPEGHVQHWTRPLDAMIWVGGLFLSPFFGFRDGLALWANILSPLLLVLVLWPMWRLARQLVGREEAAWALGAFALYRGTLESFLWGRADHHSLLVGGQVLFFLGFVIFFLHEEHRTRRAFWTGLVAAFVIWVNLEALFYVLIGLMTLGLYWLWGHRELLKASIAMSAGLTVGVFTGTIVEWGPRMMELHPVDTISVIYVVVFGLTTCFWALLWAVDGRREAPLGFLPRVGLAAGGALAVLGGISLIAPELFTGPFHMVEELYRETRLSLLAEQLPMLIFVERSPVQVFGQALTFLYFLPPTLWVVWRRIQGEIPEKEKWIWAMMGAMALFCAVLAQTHAVRWHVYIALGAALGYGVVCKRIHHWLHAHAPQALGAAVRPVGLFLLLFSPAVVGLMLANEEGEPTLEIALEGGAGEGGASENMAEESLHIEDCDGRVAASLLNDRERFPEPILVLADPTLGSEILYRTEHHVLSIANHRPQPGFRLFVEVMRERDFQSAHERLVERGVDVILACVLDLYQADSWGALSAPGEAATFMESLLSGERVQGFEPLAEPTQSGGWWLYAVEGVSSEES